MAAENWDLIVPFFMDPHSNVEGGAVHLLDREGFLRCANPSTGKYQLKLSGFASEERALETLPRVVSALLWAATILRDPIRPVDTLARVEYLETPKSLPGFGTGGADAGPPYVDAVLVGEGSFVKPHNKMVAQGEGSRVTLEHHWKPGRFVEALDSSRVLGHPERVAGNPRLILANDLYASALDASTAEARVISFCTVIESLLDERPASGPVIAAVDGALEWANASRGACEPGSPEHEAYSDLIQALCRHKKMSISKRFVEMGSVLLEDDSMGPQLRLAYNTRSSLLHEGQASAADVAASEDSLRALVPRMLAATYKVAAGI